MTADSSAIRTIFERKNFTVERPLFPMIHKPGSHGIRTNVMPFLRVGFRAAQQMIKKVFCQCGGSTPPCRNVFEIEFFNDLAQIDRANF